MTPPCAPILILAFNRPELCTQVLDAIRNAEPRLLFFAVDGPRSGHPTDAEQCEKTRSLIKSVNWPCTIKTLFRETNRGCKYAPPEAITWFFSHVSSGIILEDDCIPTEDFLVFSSILLEKYEDHDQIGMITGNNHFGYQTDKTASYHFSAHASIWGWATWRRAWNLYDVEMSRHLADFPKIKQSLGQSEAYRRFWWRHVDSVVHGMNTWDVQWSVALHANRKLVIRPRCNLVRNVGFSKDSTHTAFEYNSRRYEQTAHLDFPLKHPSNIAVDAGSDLKLEQRTTNIFNRALNFIGAKAYKIKEAFT